MVHKHRRPKIAISSGQNALRVPRKKLLRLISFVARREGANLKEVDLAIVGKRQIASLNRKYLGHAGATDVLSFDLSAPGAGGVCAQLIVCAESAVEHARARKYGPQRELMLYVVHGLLHLMGYDDANDRLAARMHAREEDILRTFSRSRAR